MRRSAFADSRILFIYRIFSRECSPTRGFFSRFPIVDPLILEKETRRNEKMSAAMKLEISKETCFMRRFQNVF